MSVVIPPIAKGTVALGGSQGSGGDRPGSTSTSGEGPTRPRPIGRGRPPQAALEEGSQSAKPSPAWSAAVAAVALLAIDPKTLGGLVVRGPSDPARDCLLALHRDLLPADAPVRKIPIGVADAQLLGGLELTATLATGRPVLQRGLLGEADRGALVIPGAERLPNGVAGRLAMALDTKAVAIARDGFDISFPARFAVIACDEALADEEPPPAILTERLGLIVSLAGVTRADLDSAAPDTSQVAAARARVSAVEISDAATGALGEAALSLGVFGLRPLIFARAAARAAAALAGRNAVEHDDLALAGRLVLGPRATRLPAADETEAPAPQPERGESDASTDRSGDREDESDADPREMAEQVLEAATATIPSDILAAAASASSPTGRSPSRTPGTAGAARVSKRRGRPIGARAGHPGGGARLDLLETLRAAAPWQRIRRRALDPSSVQEDKSEGPRILVRREDFRIQRLKERRRTITIFVVDASGSAALHRLAEAKGAVELLLRQAYVRRDEVALIAFRGTAAELLLPPTRSLTRAKRSLAGLPGGGGTPLASAIDAAALMVDAARRRGDTPVVVFLTDGAANVARDGTGGRVKAQEEATSAARALKGFGCSSIVVDVSPRPQPRAKELAEAMGARYAPLPRADAAAVARAIA